MKILEAKDNIALQAEKHELVRFRRFMTREEYLLYLIHKKPYEDISVLSAKKNVLDLGCNDGYGTNIIGTRCNKIIGVDVSAKAINAAKRYFGKTNIEFILIDGYSLPFSNAVFDVVTCFQVIEHVLETNHLMKEISRVLKPGGCAVFTTPNSKIRLLEGMKPWNKLHVREYSACEFGSLLKNHFSSVSLEGLFAQPFLDNIERSRIHRALSAAKKSRARNQKKNILRRIMPVFIKNYLKYFRFMLKERKEIGKIIQTYSRSDLFYLTENLDDSLDLRANCIN